jgi:hypothetical protein
MYPQYGTLYPPDSSMQVLMTLPPAPRGDISRKCLHVVKWQPIILGHLNLRCTKVTYRRRKKNHFCRSRWVCPHTTQWGDGRLVGKEALISCGLSLPVWRLKALLKEKVHVGEECERFF